MQPTGALPRVVLLIQADDLGIDDLGFHGNPLAHTPNLDALAGEAIRCEDFTVNPVCAPSRATLLTGRHFLRTGVSHVHGGKQFLHPDERTLADAFQAAGWRTGMWGKWHLGTLPGYLPWERGFEEAYMAKLYRHENSSGELNGDPVATDTWADSVLVDYALDFLDRHPDDRCLLYLPSMTPHTPLEAPAGWVAFHRERGLPRGLATLYAMVSHLDEEIGRLLRGLDERGLYEETLLLFTSDNGPALSRGQMTDAERHLRKRSARRGWKGDLWENGVRAPLLVRWPSALRPRTLTCPLDQVNLLPTLLDWCDVPWPKAWPALDGASDRRTFETGAAPPEDAKILNYAHPGWLATRRPYSPLGIPGEYNPVAPGEKPQLRPDRMPLSLREGRFKFLLNPLAPESPRQISAMLVDLYEDPGETTDVSAEYPETAARLRATAERWFSEIRDSDHSFTAPRIRVPGDGVLCFPATNPIRVRGRLQNSVTALRGWTEPGDEAEYELILPDLGPLTLTLHWSREIPETTAFEIESPLEKFVCHGTGQRSVASGPMRFASGCVAVRLKRRAAGPVGDLLRIELRPAGA